VFQYPVRAGGAHRAAVFPLPMRTPLVTSHHSRTIWSSHPPRARCVSTLFDTTCGWSEGKPKSRGRVILGKIVR
jgi:hypothetical protein